MYRTALVMIARNEARCISRCLASVRPWVDEMIVLDTGSTDDTVAIARSLGAQVHHFTWCDDFSAARNAALAHSHADWHIVLDADEWVQSGGQALADLRGQAPDRVHALAVCSEFGSVDSAGDAPHHATSWISRVLPRGVRYEGLIHEQPHHSLPVHRLPVVIGHDGYAPQALQDKGDRNARLLQAALRARPDDAYLRYQWGKDHEVHDRFDEACQAYAQAWPHCPDEAGWRHDLLIRWLFVLKQTGHLDEAVSLAEAQLPHWTHSADFFFTVGDVLLSQALAKPSEAEALLPLIESCWLRCLELGDTPDLEGAVAGRGSHLAAHNLVVFYDSLGQAEKADAYRARSTQAPVVTPAHTPGSPD
jgi:hypothetical protein